MATLDADDLNAIAALIPGAVWDEAVNLHGFAGTFGYSLLAAQDDSQAALTYLKVASSTVQTSGASSVTLWAFDTAADEIYTGALIVITSGPGAGQSRLITAYDATTKVATVDPAWAVQPTNASVYAILPHGAVYVSAAGRPPGDYPTAITYRTSAPAGAIDTITWASGKTWTYSYTGTRLSGIAES